MNVSPSAKGRPERIEARTLRAEPQGEAEVKAIMRWRTRGRPYSNT